LLYLDFSRIKPLERQRALRFAESATGAALEADVQAELRQQERGGRDNGIQLSRDNNHPDASKVFGSRELQTGSKTKTFIPGEHLGVVPGPVSSASLSPQEKSTIVDLLQKATTAKELEMIEHAVQHGNLTEIVTYFDSKKS
jgi:hypothetical protein